VSTERKTRAGVSTAAHNRIAELLFLENTRERAVAVKCAENDVATLNAT